jgi:hypothetical protein
MLNERTAVRDEVTAVIEAYREAHPEQVGILGVCVAELHDKDGNLKARSVTKNLVTAVGDQYYAGRAALSSGLPAQVTGFRLGTGSTAVAKSGAGAAIVTYLATSNKANDATFPTAVAGVVTWKRTYAAGEATSASPITEVVLNTDTIANDNATTATAANTISRALIAGVSAKGASDVLTVTWTHTILGA